MKVKKRKEKSNALALRVQLHSYIYIYIYISFTCSLVYYIYDQILFLLAKCMNKMNSALGDMVLKL